MKLEIKNDVSRINSFKHLFSGTQSSKDAKLVQGPDEGGSTAPTGR